MEKSAIHGNEEMHDWESKNQNEAKIGDFSENHPFFKIFTTKTKQTVAVCVHISMHNSMTHISKRVLVPMSEILRRKSRKTVKFYVLLFLCFDVVTAFCTCRRYCSTSIDAELEDGVGFRVDHPKQA